jgi:hypothetical protein
MRLDNSPRFLFFLGFLTPIAALISLFAVIHRNDARALRDLDGFLTRGSLEFEACRAWRREFAKIDDGHFRNAHDSRAQALAVLRLLEKYPGWAAPYAQAADYLDDREAELSRNVHQLALIERRGEIEADCHMLAFFRHSRLLLGDLRTYPLTRAERARIEAILVRYLTSEPRFRSFMEGGLKSALLVSYLAAFPGTAKAKEMAEALQTDFERKRARLLGHLQRSHVRWKGYTLRGRELETRYTRELFRSYYLALREARI